MKSERYAWDDDEYQTILRQVEKKPNASSYPQPELIYYNISKNAKEASYSVAYKMTIHSLRPLYKKSIYVDARTGEILNEVDLIHRGCGVPHETTADVLYYSPKTEGRKPPLRNC